VRQLSASFLLQLQLHFISFAKLWSLSNSLFSVLSSTFSAFLLRVPKGLEDVSKYPHLFAALLESDKWSEEDIAKLAGRNLIRVFKEVEAVSPQQKTHNS